MLEVSEQPTPVAFKGNEYNLLCFDYSYYRIYSPSLVTGIKSDYLFVQSLFLIYEELAVEVDIELKTDEGIDASTTTKEWSLSYDRKMKRIDDTNYSYDNNIPIHVSLVDCARGGSILSTYDSMLQSVSDLIKTQSDQKQIKGDNLTELKEMQGQLINKLTEQLKASDSVNKKFIIAGAVLDAQNKKVRLDADTMKTYDSIELVNAYIAGSMDSEAAIKSENEADEKKKEEYGFIQKTYFKVKYFFNTLMQVLIRGMQKVSLNIASLWVMDFFL
ncbi:MAG: hypothetical protein QS721_03805 [Candidatus Endonucleobacter sp. (ex Gigantidas childressi)]|nr:hypothetical protein [Candidatus Endonucleobacter sp. (ex Gigantidas childressi)]